MTPEQTAAALKKPIGELGMQFMADPLTRDGAKELGLRGRQMYYLGRGGALGDVPPEIVCATFAFIPLEVVTEHWNAARAVMSPAEGALAYARFCNEWGRRNLTDLPGTDRVLELLERVVDGAQGAGLPLFVGWRLLPRPDDVPGRLAQVINVMREHRGSVHACAIAAVGLGPLEANLAGSYGALSAKFFSWPEPYPDPEPYKAQWEQAEWLTATGATPPYALLTDDERSELVTLLTEIHAHLGMANPLG
ncbi:MAG: hypothetical protein QOJ79_371 [Actinomycetota bacterium]|nr:hypothetical protein [Actinomycetota bacterium]